MKNNLTIFFIILVLGFNSCGTANNTVGKGLDWTGLYRGIVPGADSAINAGITLNRDSTYKATYQYLDKSDDVFTYTGTFKWKDKNTIELDTTEIPSYYRVGKNTLTQLDMEGRTIVGGLSNNYVLMKE